MFDFVPLPFYSAIYYNIILIFIIITIIHTSTKTGYTKSTNVFNKVLGITLFWFIVLYMGLRPVSWYFGDMGNYAKSFDKAASGESLADQGDVLFYSFISMISIFDSKPLFFFSIAFIYVSSIYIAAKRLFHQYHYFAFLIIIASFEFWSYGTNGIRNGLATSLVFLAFTYMNKKLFMYVLFFMAFSIHSSVLIPITAYFITTIYKSKSFYFKMWILSIFLSLFIGGVMENFIISLGIMSEDIVSIYFQNKDLYASSFAMSGFRWDFLIYSSLGVSVSYYFIFVKKINDKYYSQLSNIYLVSNSMWILVIEASFSNRFAYLSWFLMGVIIIYPFLKKVYWKKQFFYIGLVILFYYSFTYFMNFVLLNI